MAKDVFNNTSTVSMGEWLVIHLLMLVPILNIILLVKWSFSGTEKESKSNWAKLYLILTIIGVIAGSMAYIFNTIGRSMM
jgi:hypothetical protein